MPTPRRRSSGFSLIELLIVTVLGSLIVMATYNVLITNQRTYAATTTKIRDQQSMRAAVNILFSELREISPAEGDIHTIGRSALEVQVMRSFGLVCGVLYTLPPRLFVKRVGDWFRLGDQVVFLADNDPLDPSDDVWKTATVGSVDTTSTCSGTDQAQVITLRGTIGPPPDSVNPGAPVRAVETYTYGTFFIDGEPYLARRAGTDPPELLVGPLRMTFPGALEFRYYDALGAPTGIPTSVRRIEMVIRTEASVPGPTGRFLTDSVVVNVYPRN